MTQPANDDDPGQGRTGALEALLHVAQQRDITRDYPIMTAAFQPEDYEEIIALAWRHQFNDDRSRFKREIRRLQEHVCQRIDIPEQFG